MLKKSVKMTGMGMGMIAVIFVAIFGLVAGSFLNVCIYRLPVDESIVFPSSHCPKCGNKLSFFDLIPVLSYIFLSGRCRYCKKEISIIYPIVESLACFVSVILFLKFGLSLNFVFNLMFSYGLIVLFFSDLKTQIMPDQINYFLIATGILYSLLLKDIFSSIAGVILCFAVMYSIYLLGKAIYKREAIGGGDIKFAVALGAFFGWKLGLLSIFLSYLIGCVYSLILLGLKLRTKEQEIPFGPAMVLAAYVVMFFGDNILNWYLAL